MSRQTAVRARQLAGEILRIARREGVQPGERLFEYRLAQRLSVSRGPVRAALQELAAAGLASSVPNRGYLLSGSLDSAAAHEMMDATSAGEQQYMRIVNDRFEGRLPDVVRENELMRRYELKRSDLRRLLDRIAAEGWVERLSGYGWRFAQTISNPDAYQHAMRVRMIIEPAGIREPTFKLDDEAASRIHDQQERVLNGGLEVFTPAEVFQFGCEFHETIARASGNPFLLHTLRRINSVRRLFAYRRVIPDHTTIKRRVREHLQLLELLGRGQLEDAAEFMLLHLQERVGDQNVNCLDERPHLRLRRSAAPSAGRRARLMAIESG